MNCAKWSWRRRCIGSSGYKIRSIVVWGRIDSPVIVVVLEMNYLV